MPPVLFCCCGHSLTNVLANSFVRDVKKIASMASISVKLLELLKLLEVVELAELVELWTAGGVGFWRGKCLSAKVFPPLCFSGRP